MRHDALEERSLNYTPCRYGTSKIFFRGPQRSLDGRYVTFVGGTETYGKFIKEPFAQLVERQVGMPTVNFGCANASIGAFLAEPTVVDACRGAHANVVQIMGAQNLSNRFYSVHPRRNDRFLKPSTVLEAIYPEVDFADFCFTRHMLIALHELSAERFEIVRGELQQAWVSRMTTFLREIGPHTSLLWFSDYPPSDRHWSERPEGLQAEPLFITRRMIDSLRPLVRSVIVVQPSEGARAEGTRGMYFAPQDAGAAQGLPGPQAHREAADAISETLHALAPAE
ncbi:DUF6473 family protein [Pseudoroseicyclus tamaricis]|uniref:DUF6473 domain-containing protein n=2 Tax=Pseudoroseicyclus tamaricis TaxID=2705421 RepID=A0A6B2K070_9RHOB|nr:DUF6473 family protein [Pseudoroseicyclus tamaricis]NDV02339.1 hypothetical protein [Pseudoroseicyclus tamaricis]